MSYLEEGFEQLLQEHGVLLRCYGQLQQRCTKEARAQAQEVQHLQQQLVQLRAQLILRDSLLAWQREDHHRQLAMLARQPEYAFQPPDTVTVPARLQLLRQERVPVGTAADAAVRADSMRLADLVICQTGCVSHGAFWRVEDHCQRTGKACVLADQPDALRVVHIQPHGAIEPSHPGTAASTLSCEKDVS